VDEVTSDEKKFHKHVDAKGRSQAVGFSEKERGSNSSQELAV
jgi:hypothetical protein